MLRDVVSGMTFLHAASPPVLHNDLKAANILVDANFRAKVSDFGLSSKRSARRGPPGTPFWMAPELLRRRGQPSTATDVYALGVTMSEVFSRGEPYAEVLGKSAEILARVAGGSGGKPLRPAIGASVPPLFGALMARCWHADAAMRPSMAMVDAELRLAAAGADAGGGADGDAAAGVTAALAAARHRHAGERKLLHAMFPPAVAAALAEGRRVEPQEYECVTVFFSDVVGFTGALWALLAHPHHRALTACFCVRVRRGRHVCCDGACEGDGYAGSAVPSVRPAHRQVQPL
jgi:hypothetical protein